MSGPGGFFGPDTGSLAGMFAEMIAKDSKECDHHLTELVDTVIDTEKRKEPVEFSYAKMVNYLRSREFITDEELVHLCAAALWRLNGQENADIYVLKAGDDVISIRREENDRR